MKKVLKRKLFNIIEYGFALFFRLQKRCRESSDPKNLTIGFLEINGLGDMVLADQALRNLRSHFPHAKIILIATPVFLDVFKQHPALSKIIPLDVPWRLGKGKYNLLAYWKLMKDIIPLKRENMDVTIDTRGDLRRHILMALLGVPIRVGYDKLAGGVDMGYKGRLLTHTEQYPPKKMHRLEENVYLVERWARSYLNLPQSEVVFQKIRPQALHRTNPTIALHRDPNWLNKSMDDEWWLDLLSKLQAKYAPSFILLGTDKMKEESFVQKAAAQSVKITFLSLPLLLLLEKLKNVDLFIGVDSGPMHMADMAGCPVVALFGPSDVDLWHPYQNGVERVAHHQSLCDYAPCKVPVCRMIDCRCIRTVTVREVMEKITDILGVSK